MSRPPTHTRNPRPWQIPEEARRRGLRNSLIARRNQSKCGARTRVTGEPCKQPVKAEGLRCRFHGGATPKGAEWHRRQLPKKGDSWEKASRKLATWQKRDREAEARRASMSPEQLAEHNKRRAALKPGTPAERARRKHNREAKRFLESIIKTEPSEKETIFD